jgi:polyisoprenoid-binding protein YceI
MTSPARQSETTATTATFAPGVWRIDPASSEVGFRTRKLGLIPVRGRFEEFGGQLRVDADGTATGEVTIEAASIRTGIKKRDAHLRTEDFFHSDEYPQLVFVSDPVEAGAAPRITGALRIRDKDLPIDAPARIEAIGESLRLEADFEVDHDAAGFGWSKPGILRKTVAAHVTLTLVPAASE